MILVIVAFVVGNIFGAVALTRWYLHRIKQPEVANEMLARLYGAAHKHPLSVGQFDPTGVCPVCGYALKGLVNEAHSTELIASLREELEACRAELSGYRAVVRSGNL